MISREFTAVYKKSGKWFLAWIEEVPGVNTQGRTLKEVKENLKDALLLVLETNRELIGGGNKLGSSVNLCESPCQLSYETS